MGRRLLRDVHTRDATQNSKSVEALDVSSPWVLYQTCSACTASIDGLVNVMTTDVAKPIAGTDSKYLVNSEGEVFGPRGKLKPILMEIGYHSVALSLGAGIVKRHYVHRLVAEAFIGPIPSDMVVDHVNHDKTDNRLENLRLVSRKENGAAWVKTGSRVSPNSKSMPSLHCKKGHTYSYTKSGSA